MIKALHETEAQFTDSVIALARLCKWRVMHARPGRVKRRGKETYETPFKADGKGWPDLFCVRGNRCVVIELKVGKNKTSPEQDIWLDCFRQTPVETYLIRPADWKHLEAILA